MRVTLWADRRGVLPLGGLGSCQETLALRRPRPPCGASSPTCSLRNPSAASAGPSAAASAPAPHLQPRLSFYSPLPDVCLSRLSLARPRSRAPASSLPPTASGCVLRIQLPPSLGRHLSPCHRVSPETLRHPPALPRFLRLCLSVTDRQSDLLTPRHARASVKNPSESHLLQVRSRHGAFRIQGPCDLASCLCFASPRPATADT